MVVLAGYAISPADAHQASAPTVITGVVTQSGTGAPVIGARVQVGSQSALSVAGGVYSLSLPQPGTYPVQCTKAGFDNFSSAPVSFAAGSTVVYNISLSETLITPASLLAALDTADQEIDLAWPAPVGSYELIYDDGVQENFTVWGAAGNMNAVKFTPAGYPVTLTGGMIHIGVAANYPPGSNPLNPFQVRIYDAAGTGGTPGNSLAGPFNVTPATYGWISFTLTDPLTIQSGSFFIAMVQGGNPPNAAGIAIDETTPQFRSYSRFVSGGGPWYPAGGNFLIRAACHGPGGPFMLGDAPAAWTSFDVYQLRQGEEQNPAVWNFLCNTGAFTCQDTGWSMYPCGPYRWGIRTRFPGNRVSSTVFSNVIGKCWTVPVSLLIASSCTTAGPAGTAVRLANLAYPDTVYSAIADSAGQVLFPAVWKGSYKLFLTRFGYDTIQQQLQVVSPVTQSFLMMQMKFPPENLTVNDSSLMARWDVPRYEKVLFSETWSAGNFSASAWTVPPGSNWTVQTTYGNPAPAAHFSGLPHLAGYSQPLTSKIISGERSTLLKLRYDIQLSNAGNTTVNEMAVEIWNGLDWMLLKNYSNSGGTVPWTTADLDISAYSCMDFRLRFRATGGDSYDINYWNIDNIMITASEPAQELSKCILGYYFYLGNAITGYTTKNIFPVPPGLVQYGQTYQACVIALYGNGYSDTTCTTFTSRFLYPVRNIHGLPIENSAWIAWEKPLIVTDTGSLTPEGILGYQVYRDDSLVGTVTGPDFLEFYDHNLDPGRYLYGVSAKYDLASYGFPGQTGESLPDGPLHILINYGREIPFFESWDFGTFDYNEWRFEPSQGNWTITTAGGLPAPAATFSGQPPGLSYDYALESPTLNALAFECAAIWLDFDVRLQSLNHTGNEKLTVEVFYDHAWHKRAEMSNTGNIPWTNHHIDISAVRGKGFRIRFRAQGHNSFDILNWYLDNISVTPVCYPAVNLQAVNEAGNVKLTWSPPACFGGNLLNEGFEGSLFPPVQWSRTTVNPNATWSHNPSATAPGAHSGNFSAAVQWDYSHQDEWLIAHNIYISGNLTFWSYAFQGSLHQDHYYVKVSVDQGATWDILLDLSALPPYPGPNGINDWDTPYHIDLSNYLGMTVDIAWHAIDGDGNGLWYPWAIDDCSIGADDIPSGMTTGLPAPPLTRSPVHPLTGSPVHRFTRIQKDAVTGYDIYRRDYGAPGFVRINPEPVTDTSYTDTELPEGVYEYYVYTHFSECAQSTHSDTVAVSVITSAGETAENRVNVYPNPACDRLQINCDLPPDWISIMSITGTVYIHKDPGGETSVMLDLKGIPRGMAILKLRIREKTVVRKIILIDK
jgi:hypothetical protein